MKNIFIFLSILCSLQLLNAQDASPGLRVNFLQQELVNSYVNFLNLRRRVSSPPYGEPNMQALEYISNLVLSQQTQQLEERPFTEYSMLYTLHNRKNNNTYGVGRNNVFTSWGRYATWGHYAMSAQNNVLEVRSGGPYPKLVEQFESTNTFNFRYKAALESLRETNRLIQEGADIAILGEQISPPNKSKLKDSYLNSDDLKRADAFIRILDAHWLLSYTPEALMLARTMLTVGKVKGDSVTSFGNTLLREIDRRDPEHPLKKILLNHGAEKSSSLESLDSLRQDRFQEKYLQRNFDVEFSYGEYSSRKVSVVSDLQHAVDMEYLQDVRYILEKHHGDPNQLINIHTEALVAFLKSKPSPEDLGEARLIERVKDRIFQKRLKLLQILIEYGWAPPQDERAKHLEFLNSWKQSDEVKRTQQLVKNVLSKEERTQKQDVSRKKILMETFLSKRLLQKVDQGYVVTQAELTWVVDALNRYLRKESGSYYRGGEVEKINEILTKLLLASSTKEVEFLSKLKTLTKIYYRHSMQNKVLTLNENKSLKELKSIYDSIDVLLKNLPQYTEYYEKELNDVQEAKRIATAIKDAEGANLVLLYNKHRLNSKRSLTLTLGGGIVGGFVIGIGLPFLASNYPEFAPLLANSLFVKIIQHSGIFGFSAGILPGLTKMIYNSASMKKMKNEIHKFQEEKRQEEERARNEAKVYRNEAYSVAKVLAAKPVNTCQAFFGI